MERHGKTSLSITYFSFSVHLCTIFNKNGRDVNFVFLSAQVKWSEAILKVQKKSTKIRKPFA